MQELHQMETKRELGYTIQNDCVDCGRMVYLRPSDVARRKNTDYRCRECRIKLDKEMAAQRKIIVNCVFCGETIEKKQCDYNNNKSKVFYHMKCYLESRGKGAHKKPTGGVNNFYKKKICSEFTTEDIENAVKLLGTPDMLSKTRIIIQLYETANKPFPIRSEWRGGSTRHLKYMITKYMQSLGYTFSGTGNVFWMGRGGDAPVAREE